MAHGRRSSGVKTQSTIVRAAERVLAQNGRSGLTTRAVAEAAGVSLGNLSYYFPTIDSLIEAVIQSVLVRYSAEFDKKLAHLRPNATTQLVKLMEWLVEDGAKKGMNRLSRQLWALEATQPRVAAAMAQLYNDAREKVAAMVHAMYPHATKRQVRDFTLLMAVLCEGSAVLVGNQDKGRPTVKRLSRVTREVIRSRIMEFSRSEEASK